LRRTGAGGRRRREQIDASAATVILQSWLDARR
jgi:RNase H-fold protein (predicted Holliday junction resolvase)